MTILHLGHQPTEVPGVSSLLVTTAGAFDSTLDINGLHINVPTAGSITFPIILPTVPTGDMWFSFRYRTSSTNANSIPADGMLFEVLDSNLNQIARLSSRQATNGLHATANGDTVVNSTGFLVQTNNVAYWIDVRVAVGANIVMDFYIDGTLIGTATAANTGGKGGPKTIMFQNNRMHSGAGATSAFLAHFAVTDGVSTIGRRFVRRRPNALSSQTAMTGDTAALSDATIASRIVSATAGERRSFTLQGPTGPASPSAIPAVHVKILGQAGQSGPTQGRAFLRMSSVNYDGTFQSFPFIRPDFIMNSFTQNPATSTPWTTATLPTEVGIQSN